ncbi:hypothetical protein PAPHI01_1088 [Pancytospora philotis]|nr:hypothetical protein PAPHI01_1088 [Pancytospora philotis]
MQKLERKLYEKYGPGIIPKSDMRGVMDEAVALRIIDRREAQTPDAVDVAGLLEHLSMLRRGFLEKELDALEEQESCGAYSGAGSCERRSDPQLMDRALKAYFEYMKMQEVTERRAQGRPWRRLLIGLLVALVCYALYTPKPY